MQVLFPITRRLKIELKIVPKMHFHQFLAPNFGAAFITRVMQSDDLFFFHVIADTRPL
jgi:hypothetical protein